MRTSWDYSDLAQAYLKRPDYAATALDAMLDHAGIRTGAPVCDIGAGVGHLTRYLAAKGLAVTAVEPNDAMRALGMNRTVDHPEVRWFEATGEDTGQPDSHFALVTFGSSFNVMDRPKALAETARILRPGGFFACLWNHRDLHDPIQAGIEAVIRTHVPDYRLGERREDQTPVIDASRLFKPVRQFEGRIVHRQAVTDTIEAWRSHATLARQAKAAFPVVIAAIAAYLAELGQESIDIPYDTRIWLAEIHQAG